MSSSSSSNSSGVGVFGLLGIAFVVLKLTNVIDWSWWLVTIPFWGGIALVLIGFALAGCFYGLAKLFDNVRNHTKE